MTRRMVNVLEDCHFQVVEIPMNRRQRPQQCSFMREVLKLELVDFSVTNAMCLFFSAYLSSCIFGSSSFPTTPSKHGVKWQHTYFATHLGLREVVYLTRTVVYLTV